MGGCQNDTVCHFKTPKIVVLLEWPERETTLKTFGKLSVEFKDCIT